MTFPGYAGRILYVDLTSGNIRIEPLSEKWMKDYLGGWGINYRLAYDLIEPHGDPFSPANPIILGLGPLVGTLYPGAVKLMATTKMPMTASADGRHFVATSTGGSTRFSLMLKSAGYDHVVIQGRSESPVYLRIDDEKVEICDAEDLWGKLDIYQTADELSKRHEGYGAITIGKAGENKVRFAMAIIDKTSHLGKSGLGAVMGSKNLKAIVVRGTGGIKPHDPRRFMDVVDQVRRMPASNPIAQRYQKIGLSASWDLIWVKNYYQSERWTKDEWSRHYGVNSVKNVLHGIQACTSCPVGCRAHHVVKNGPYAGTETYTAHYLYSALVGARLEIEDPGTSIKFVDICNRAGMCAINALGMVDWVTRLYTEGEIDNRVTEDLKLNRDIESYFLLLDKVIHREGIGDVMADGWFALSSLVGKDATEAYLQQHGISKGQECIYPARAAKMDPMRITGTMTNPRGGQTPQGHSACAAPERPLKVLRRDAGNTGMSEEELDRTFTGDNFHHGILTKHIEDAYAVYNSLSVCTVWVTFGFTNVKVLSEAYSALTGIEISASELKQKGERIINLYKLLNVREGFDRKDDIPAKALLRPIKTPDGEQALTDYYHKKVYTSADLEEILDEYYEERGWDVKKGIPTAEKLRDLGLEDFANALSK